MTNLVLVFFFFFLLFFVLLYFHDISQTNPYSLHRTIMPEACTSLTPLGVIINLDFTCLPSALSCLLCHIHFTFSNTSCKLGGMRFFAVVFFSSLSTTVSCGFPDPAGITKKWVRKLLRDSGCAWQRRVLHESGDPPPLQRVLSFPCSKLLCCASSRYKRAPLELLTQCTGAQRRVFAGRPLSPNMFSRLSYTAPYWAPLLFHS